MGYSLSGSYPHHNYATPFIFPFKQNVAPFSITAFSALCLCIARPPLAYQSSTWRLCSHCINDKPLPVTRRLQYFSTYELPLYCILLICNERRVIPPSNFPQPCTIPDKLRAHLCQERDIVTNQTVRGQIICEQFSLRVTPSNVDRGNNLYVFR